ncbi:MAG TPA: hypothetical protein VHX60_00780 [Acidobacteriaceae bacterium]|jgi:hypothetical protein|nr:hypothetical protein [Acidobacteriaceae bacterium]
MKPILRRTGLAALALGLLAAPAFAGPAPGTPAPGAAMQQAVPADAAGSTGIPGGNSVTGANTDQGGGIGNHAADTGSTVGRSSAELPNNDAGTPINNGPKGTAGSTGTINQQ